MKTVAIVSTTGGAGRTTLCAALAVLLARRGRAVVAVDFDPQNLLGAHLGLDTLAASGLAAALAGGGEPWHAHTWRSADGVLFVPYGQVDAAGVATCEARLAADLRWLARALGEIALPGGENADDDENTDDNNERNAVAHGVALIDAARYPSQHAEHAIRCADLVLCVAPPDPAACVTIAARIDALRAAGVELRIVVNRLNPARDMQRDAIAMLRAAAGPSAILDVRVHHDAAVPESFARGGWIFDDVPHSQASHDLHGVANWLDAWLGPRAGDGR
ncbi:cellulose biosynthesis protein BcsQ [Burkholderia guangdongensis]|uniref:cellulose biosynthesis protein BcsQ n=1 Tax=Burkholderia guangdongensis TaxID=1792500 RepID=UPI0015CCA4FD|nr:cellulose biosynthesis protein BcsQ [Burkholderia guangdongensis]